MDSGIGLMSVILASSTSFRISFPIKSAICKLMGEDEMKDEMTTLNSADQQLMCLKLI